MTASESTTRKSKAVGIIMVPLNKLVPTPDNKRRQITNASVESLARSMKHDGVIQPIVVRAHPKKKGLWEIRAGERRWRAAKVAGLKQMPAIVRRLDDQAALSITLAENLERENLHPLEEAATMQQAFDRGYDIKAFASSLGRSVMHVTRRASLTRLTKEWREVVLNQEHPASRLSPAHLELIARLPEETQTLLAADDCYAVLGRGMPTVDDLRRLLDGNLHSLGAMPWKPDDDAIDPKAGACVACPKRSGSEPALFDDGFEAGEGKASKADRCLDPQCYDRKLAAHLSRCEAELRRDHPELKLVQIGFDRLSPGVQDAFGERTSRMYGATFVKASHARATPAMQIDGPKAGKLVFLDLGSANGQNGEGRRPGQRARDKDGKPVPLSLEERVARLKKRRDALVVKEVHTRLSRFTISDAVKFVEGLPPFSTEHSSKTDVLSLLLAFGTTERADRSFQTEVWGSYDKLCMASPEARLSGALHNVVQIWASRLRATDSSVVTGQAVDSKRICAILGWDFEAMSLEAARAIPEPKAWAALRAQAKTETLNGEAKPSKRSHGFASRKHVTRGRRIKANGSLRRARSERNRRRAS